MKICNICHKISATDQDHLDCIQKRRIDLEDDDFKNKLPEKLELSNNPQDLAVEMRAILEHLSKGKDKENKL
ncbi:MAG: hypothetical protein IIA82_05405 [Thaumarchaeota archaeon]|nr:hypothetical protein [Nitrososphaerota archaeon]